MYYYNGIEFGNRVRLARKSRGYTQEKLAEELNISREFFGRVERGTQSCSIDLIIGLCSILNVSSDYLLMGKEPRKANQKTELLKLAEQLVKLAEAL